VHFFRYRRALPLLALTALFGTARAQYIDIYLPATVPGFDQEQGVTVQSRLRPLYTEQGMAYGAFTLRGGIDEKVGVNSNITGTSNGPSSAFIETNPSVSADSNWDRNRLGISASADRVDYLSAARQSHTDWTVAIDGGWTILRDMLDIGYSHVHGNEFGTAAGAVSFDAPVPYDIDILRASYTFEQGRVSLTPNIALQLYQFGPALSGGQTLSQSFRDRTVLSGGVTGRYSFSKERSFVLVVQGSASNYLHDVPGAPSNNSQSILILPGIDYQASGPWRYRLLVGGEFRNYDAAQYGSRVSPVIEASVIYTPTELTTITGTLRRAVEDPEAEGTSGYTVTGLSLRVDHELRRNVLLQANASFQAVDYFQGLGSANTYAFGGQATWLLDNHLSAYASYEFTTQNGSGAGPAALAARYNELPSYRQNLALIGLRWRL
jgi:hypothetical protein